MIGIAIVFSITPPRRRLRLRASVSSALVALAFTNGVACSILTSTDDLTGGSDASVDQAVTDGPSSEASSEGSADVPPPRFCSTLSPAPALCEDFDGTSSFDAQFSQDLVGSPNTIGADNTSSKSSPRSFFAHINAGSNPGRAYAYMFKTFAGPVTRISFAFDIMLVDVVSGESSVVAGIVVNDGMPTRHALALLLSGVDAQTEETFVAAGVTQYKDKVLSRFPVVKTWSRVEVDMALSPPTMTVKVDGTTTLDGVALDPSWPTSGSVQINLGVTYVTSTAGAWLVRYDNVVADPK